MALRFRVAHCCHCGPTLQEAGSNQGSKDDKICSASTGDTAFFVTRHPTRRTIQNLRRIGPIFQGHHADKFQRLPEIETTASANGQFASLVNFPLLLAPFKRRQHFLPVLRDFYLRPDLFDSPQPPCPLKRLILCAAFPGSAFLQRLRGPPCPMHWRSIAYSPSVNGKTHLR